MPGLFFLSRWADNSKLRRRLRPHFSPAYVPATLDQVPVVWERYSTWTSYCGPITTTRHVQDAVRALRDLSKRLHPRLGPRTSSSLLAVIRKDRHGYIVRSKAFYHAWKSVYLHRLMCDHPLVVLEEKNGEQELHTPEHWSTTVQLLPSLRYHRVGPNRVRLSLKLLYKATIQRLRDVEAHIVSIKAEFIRVRITMRCKARCHTAAAGTCAACHVIFHVATQMWQTHLVTGAAQLFPVSFLYDFFKGTILRLRASLTPLNSKLSRYEGVLFPVAASVICHYLSKHVARMKQQRRVHSSERSRRRYWAARTAMVRGLLIQGVVPIEEIYSRFHELGSEIEVWIREEAVKQQARRLEAAQRLQRAYRTYVHHKADQEAAVERAWRQRNRKKLRREAEEREAAFKRFLKRQLDLYLNVKHQHVFHCFEPGCEKLEWHNDVAYQVHLRLHLRERTRSCAKQAAEVGRRRMVNRLAQRELQALELFERDFLQRAPNRNRYASAPSNNNPEHENAAQLHERLCKQSLDPSGQPELLQDVPFKDVLDGVRKTIATKPLQLRDFLREVQDYSTVELASTDLQHCSNNNNNGPYHRRYGGRRDDHGSGSPVSRSPPAPLGHAAALRQLSRCGAERNTRSDHRAHPYLTLVSSLLSEHGFGAPQVVKLLRRQIGTLGSGDKSMIRIIQGQDGLIEPRHAIFRASWTGDEWLVTIQDNRTASGTYILNVDGVTGVLSSGQRRLYSGDRVLLGRRCTADGCMTYDVIFELQIPMFGPTTPPSSLLELPRLSRNFVEVVQDKQKRALRAAAELL